MKKNIILILGMIFCFSATFASQETVTLDPYETKYIYNYKITNTTAKKIFAPLSDITGKILGNYKGDNPSLNSFMNNFTSFFGQNTKLNNSYTIGGFKIEDTTNSITYGSWSSCSATCGGGIQSRSITCEREDGSFTLSNFCGFSNNIETRACNTQSCPPTCTTQANTSTTWVNVPLSGSISGFDGWTYNWGTVKPGCRYNNGLGRWYSGNSAWNRAFMAYNHGSQCLQTTTTYTNSCDPAPIYTETWHSNLTYASACYIDYTGLWKLKSNCDYDSSYPYPVGNPYHNGYCRSLNPDFQCLY